MCVRYEANFKHVMLAVCLLVQFQLSYSDKQRYEMEERPDVQKQILVEIARKLPIFTRAQSGGELSSQVILCLLFSPQYIISPVVLSTKSQKQVH